MSQREAAVAATELSPAQNPILRQLSLAALALPGLMLHNASAENHASAGNSATADNNTVSVLYERYQEGARDLAGMPSAFKPIAVETLLTHIESRLSPQLTAAIKLTQDTWSGATPVATAPVSAHSNRISSGPTLAHVVTGASPDSDHIHDPEAVDAPPDSANHSVTGASPYLYSSLKLDEYYRPLQTDLNGNVIGGLDSQLVHTLASASPEVRQQLDASVTRQSRRGDSTLSLGHSRERDFTAWFGQVASTWTINRQHTTLASGLSYATSKTHARLDHHTVPHIYEPYRLTYAAPGNSGTDYSSAYSRLFVDAQGAGVQGEREDWGLNLGITQVLNKTALLGVKLGLTHSLGYQSNPYKVVSVAFVDPAKSAGPAGAPYAFDAELVAVMEQRPDLRKQGNLSLTYVQYLGATDGALHSRYRYFRDSWGIDAHTLELEWVQPLRQTWTVSPHIRYYAQDAARFYHPYLVTTQSLFGPDGQPFDHNQLPAHYSSDARLSAFGTVSTGLSLRRQLAKQLNLEFSYAYIQRAAHLAFHDAGSADVGDYADFTASQFSLGLTATLPGEQSHWGLEHPRNATHEQPHAHHTSSAAPAGLQVTHLLDKTGDWMLGYRMMVMQQGGDITHNGQALDDYTLINKACYGKPCYLRPTHMTMRMHMLDIMYAPTDWLTLMLMPQFVDMTMSMRLLADSPRTGGMDAIGMAITHAQHGHRTSGLGDTELHGLLRLYRQGPARLVMGLGLSAPSAQVDRAAAPMMGMDLGHSEYGMQLGSGTWDFKPSLTLSLDQAAWDWGLQLQGVSRLQAKNSLGYALGDQLQSSLWGSYAARPDLFVSWRAVYTRQHRLSGQYSGAHVAIGPGDYPGNSGGVFRDIGFGLSKRWHKGPAAGSQLGIEWLQPVSDHPNGYQLERQGTLAFTGSLHF